jgi:hypothetical protein
MSNGHGGGGGIGDIPPEQAEMGQAGSPNGVSSLYEGVMAPRRTPSRHKECTLG